MNGKVLDEALFEKYIAPTIKPRSKSVGIEIEMPIVNLKGDAVDEMTVISVADSFRRHFGFVAESHDDNGNVNSMTERQSGDNLSFDCSYSNLELSLGKGDDLCVIHSTFKEYYEYLQGEFHRHGLTLTGMGINPAYNINHNKPVPNERYRMLYHYLHSYKGYEGGIGHRFHDRPDFGTFTSASQVQLDVTYDRLINTLNVFGLIEPYKVFLFANSYLPEYPEYLCARNMLWEHSMQGYNPHNVGLFSSKLSGVDELIEYIKSQSVYCTMREGRYINFKPTEVREFFGLDKVSGEYFDGSAYRRVDFSPEAEDLKYLRTFKFEDLTFRGTIEYRSACCQPIRDVMTVSAFHTGLAERLDELTEVLSCDKVIYSHGYDASELADMFSKRTLPAFTDKAALKEQLRRLLDISAGGLKERGRGEEAFLDVLYERAEHLESPAAKMVKGIENGSGIERFIENYSQI